MTKGLLMLGLCWAGLEARGQAGGEVYAAPGMRVHLQRGPVQLLRLKAPASIVPFVAARFWKLQDSANVKAATAFYRFVGARFRWPETTLRAGLEGRILVRLVLQPDGLVGSAEIAGRELNQAEGYSPSELPKQSRTILDTDALQFRRSLRFEPATTTDTITVPLVFRMQ